MVKLNSKYLQASGSWAKEVGFLPYVGSDYAEGIDGVRVLLLGESHYIADEASIAKAGGLRFYTRYIFEDCARDGARTWGTFFRRLDSIVARKVDPSDDEAASGWNRIAFANFVQKPVGNGARIRPDSGGWESGRRAFPHLLGTLAPHVILVVGRQAFNQTPDAPGRRIGEITVPSSGIPRSLWEMDYAGGTALMTWVYHPSWPRESRQGYVDVFNALLAKAKHRQGD